MLANINQTSGTRRNINIDFKKMREEEVKNILRNFNQCNDSIKELNKKDISLLDKNKVHRHNRTLDILLRRKKMLSEKLSLLGYKTERRGRPRKDTREKYKSTHTRISCYFTETNTNHMRQLKEEGLIENISSFLNGLLDAYFSISKDGANDER